jgi:phytoene dehydrogenase-like protein
LTEQLDAVVVGSGPNGLAAAITIARAGRSVLVLEANDTIGGGCRSAELTLPGFIHDTCSTVHAMAAASPFLRTLPLHDHGVELIHPPVPLAHPLDGGHAAVLRRSVDATADGLGRDGAAYGRLMNPLTSHVDGLLADILGPLRPPRHPITMARFGFRGLLSASMLVRTRFKEEPARVLIAANAAHAMLPLESPLSAAFGLVLATLAHTYGWPVTRGGSQNLANGLASYLRSLGGELETGRRVSSMNDIPRSRAVLFDTTPRQMGTIAADELPALYHKQLGRFRYGAGVFKLDYALSGPIPWTAHDCSTAGTVHVGGGMAEMSVSEASVWQGKIPERPLVLVVQPTIFDSSRAPAGKHTAWAYCHVPAGCTEDMTDRIEAQIERFAPGFRELVIGRHVMSPAWIEAHNANYIGGDINAGVQDWRQLFTRPTLSLNGYVTPNPRLYLCSSSTPPGGAVHGMCGYFAASAALKRVLR